MIHNKSLANKIICFFTSLFPRLLLGGPFPSSKIPAIAALLAPVAGKSNKATNGPAPTKLSPAKRLVPAITVGLASADGRKPPPGVPGCGPEKLGGAEPDAQQILRRTGERQLYEQVRYRYNIDRYRARAIDCRYRDTWVYLDI